MRNVVVSIASAPFFIVTNLSVCGARPDVTSNGVFVDGDPVDKAATWAVDVTQLLLLMRSPPPSKYVVIPTSDNDELTWRLGAVMFDVINIIGEVKVDSRISPVNDPTSQLNCNKISLAVSAEFACCNQCEYTRIPVGNERLSPFAVFTESEIHTNRLLVTQSTFSLLNPSRCNHNALLQ